jgi:GNAT superfamily N-acetyltransferase
MTTVSGEPLEILPLTPARWTDFSTLFDEGGDPKTCSCMYWRLRSKDWSFANAAETRTAMRRLVDERRDPAPGLVAYQAGRVVGWISVGPRDDYARLVSSRVRPRLDDVAVWSVVCFVVSRHARGHGLTTRLLDAATTSAREHGAPALEAYPVDPGDRRVPAAVGYTGLLSTFEAAGFRVVHRIDSPQSTVQRVIVRRDLAGR